MRELLCK